MRFVLWIRLVNADIHERSNTFRMVLVLRPIVLGNGGQTGLYRSLASDESHKNPMVELQERSSNIPIIWFRPHKV